MLPSYRKNMTSGHTRKSDDKVIVGEAMTSAADGAAAYDAIRNPGAPVPEPLDENMSAEEAATLKAEGNVLYGAGDFAGATAKFTEALRSACVGKDERAVFFANRAAAKLKIGDMRGVVDDCGESLALRASYVKARARRKEALVALHDYRAAIEDAKVLGDLEGVRVLEEKAKAKEEREKEDAISQLKDLGNSLLGNFGMSLDNFAMEQDPATGSYNIKMKQ